MKLSRYIIIFILIASGMIYVSYTFFDGVSFQKDIKAKLLKEFKGSYPLKAESTGKTVEYNLVASSTQISFMDGVNTNVWAYNGQVPGPTLRVNLGDTLRVNFTNNLPQPTTIHWHGIRVPNAMDGVPGVTQEPINPGESFVYEFIPKDAGTFWFHPHQRSSEQIERGLYGVLIVENGGTQKYSQDLAWVIDDWLVDKSGQIYDKFNTPHDLMHDGRWGNVLTVNSIVRPSFPVAPGERIRLRLINTSNARVYKPKISGVTANVIAIDGMRVKKSFLLGEINLAPGNRIDLDIVVPENAKQLILTDSFSRQINTLAYLQVEGEIAETPDFSLSKDIKFPDWDKALDLDPDIVLNLNAFRRGGKIVWTINGRAYPDVEKIKLKAKIFNKILLNNQSSRLHPMHLHGQFFKVLSRNGVPVQENFWRDTVLVNPRESVEIALVPLDKGRWLNHCHILEHAESGMMTIVEVY